MKLKLILLMLLATCGCTRAQTPGTKLITPVTIGRKADGSAGGKVTLQGTATSGGCDALGGVFYGSATSSIAVCIVGSLFTQDAASVKYNQLDNNGLQTISVTTQGFTGTAPWVEISKGGGTATITSRGLANKGWEVTLQAGGGQVQWFNGSGVVTTQIDLNGVESNFFTTQPFSAGASYVEIGAGVINVNNGAGGRKIQLSSGGSGGAGSITTEDASTATVNTINGSGYKSTTLSGVGLRCVDADATGLLLVTSADCQIVGLALTANDSSQLSLTTAYQDVPGATVTLSRAGLWKITGVLGFTLSGTHGAAFMRLNAAGAAQAPTAPPVLTTGASNLATTQTWLYTAALNDVAKLQAKINTSNGDATDAGLTGSITALWIHP